MTRAWRHALGPRGRRAEPWYILTWDPVEAQVGAGIGDHSPAALHLGAGMAVFGDAQAAITAHRSYENCSALETCERQLENELGIVRAFAGLDRAADKERTVLVQDYPELRGQALIEGANQYHVRNQLPVVSLSLAPPAHHADSENDLVSRLLDRLDDDLLVVAAVGNNGACADRSAVSIWAEHPSVVGVGALTFEMRLASYSGQGSPEIPGSGPTVVAHESSGLNPRLTGTSFATPKIARCVTVASSAIWQLRSAWQLAQNLVPDGVPLPIMGMIDDSYEEPPMEPLLPGLPFVGPSVRAISELASHVTMSADELGLRPTAPVLRRMLVAAAIPVEGYESHQVGAGYLDEEIFVPWIQHLSWGRLLEITATTAIDLPAPLAASRAFDPLGVAQLAQIVHLYRHGWFWSLDSAQLVRGRAGRLGR